MRLANPPKALIVLAALICVTLLMLLNRIETDAGVGIIGLIVGYGIGNGVAAVEGDPIQPIFDTKNPHRRRTDRDEEDHDDDT